MSDFPTDATALGTYAVLLHLADDEAHAKRAFDRVVDVRVPYTLEEQLAVLQRAVDATRGEPNA